MTKIGKSSWIVYDCDILLKCHEKFVMDHHISCSDGDEGGSKQGCKEDDAKAKRPGGDGGVPAVG